MNVDYSTKIPNNVNLSEDRQVLKALEGWHPGYMNWWTDMGPDGFQESLVYLRTAYSVDPRGWAKFDYVRMPEYRWGVLLAPKDEERTSFSPDGLTGMEANLRFVGPETMESKIFSRLTAWQNWIFQRPNAVGPDGALTRYGSGQKPNFDLKRV